MQPQPGEFQNDLFISYAHDDIKLVEPLVERLRKEGCQVWFDKTEMRATGTVADNLTAEIKRSRQMLVCLSDRYCLNQFTLFELNFNHHLDPGNRDNRTVPVVVRPLSVEVPDQIRIVPRIDLTNTETYDGEYERLRKSVLGRSAPGSFPSAADVHDLRLLSDTGAILARMIQFARDIYTHIWQRRMSGGAPARTGELLQKLMQSGGLPPTVLAQIDTIQRYATLIEVANVDRSHIEPGLQALAALSDWVTNEFGVQHAAKTAGDPFEDLWRELLRRRGTHDRPQLPETHYELGDRGRICAPLGAVYPAINTLTHGPADVVLVPLSAASRKAFGSQAERCRSLGASSPVPLEAWGDFELSDSGAWGFLAIRRSEGAALRAIASQFRPLPELLALGLLRQAVRAFCILHEASAPLARSLLNAEACIADNSGAVRLAWNWTAEGTEAKSAAFGKREEFAFGGEQNEVDDGRKDRDALVAVLDPLLSGDAARKMLHDLSQAESFEGIANAVGAANASDQDVLRTAVACCLESKALPGWITEPAREKEAVKAPGRVSLRSRIEADCRAAWPIGPGRVLSWGTDHVLRVDDLKSGAQVWRDERPLDVNGFARGADERCAVSGWEGEIRWFGNGVLEGSASAGWAIGCIVPYMDQWLAGSWNGRLFLIGGSTPTELLKVEEGVSKIAVSPDGRAAAVLGLRGSISLYHENKRTLQTVPVEGALDVAFANGAPLVLTAEGLHTVGPAGQIGRADRLPSGGAVRLLVRPTDGNCLLLCRLGRSWIVDRQGTHPRGTTLPSADASLMLSHDFKRCTAAAESGGFNYWRDGAKIRAWPEAISAAISQDGRTIVVTLPGAIEVWADET